MGAIAYFLVLFDFGIDPWRTAVKQRFASNFFDLQANAFLHGHLDLPANSLGIEGFIVHGRTYEYYPPFPALLRIPVMLVTHEFDGRLSLLSMALAWVVFATMATKLFWLVRECMRGSDTLGRGEAVLASLVLAATTGGTVLVFDASLPWAYHEVYLWATALVVGSMYWLARVSLDPTGPAMGWLAAFNISVGLTRTTGGWAMCGATLCVAAWIFTGRPHCDRRRISLVVAATAVVPLSVSIVYNYVKFGHPYLFPLQDQVWTSVNARRREALAHNGGTITGPQFLPTGVVNYLRPNGIRFTDYFPYITLPGSAARAYGGAFVDQSYRTGSVPAFMPLLFLTSLWGVVSMLRRGQSFGVRVLRLPLLGALMIPVGILDYGYVAHRYISEFVPFLALGSMIGCCDLTRRLSGKRWRYQMATIAAFAVLTGFSILANMLTGYTTAQQTWGGGKLVQYVQTQEKLSHLSASSLAGQVTRSGSLPASGRTDELHIVGNCEGLYLETGDQYEPWVLVQQRIQRVRLIVTKAKMRTGELRLFTATGVQTRYVDVETDTGGQVRFVVVHDGNYTYGPWIQTNVGEEISLMLTAHSESDAIEVSSLPGGLVAWIPLVEYDRTWHTKLASVSESLSSPSSQAILGVRLATGATGVPALCEQLANDAGITVVP